MKKGQHGFTLIELLVVVSIIALLVSILLPALGRARQVAKRVICSTHLNQIGTGIAMYMAEESQGRYPQDQPAGTWEPARQSGHWWQATRIYIDEAFTDPSRGIADGTVGNCPNHTGKDPTTHSDGQYSYRANRWIITDWSLGEPATAQGRVQLPAEKVLVFETHTETWIPGTGSYWHGGWLKWPFHPGFGNGPENQTHEHVSAFLFCDNHVASMHGDDLKDQARHWHVR